MGWDGQRAAAASRCALQAACELALLTVPAAQLQHSIQPVGSLTHANVAGGHILHVADVALQLGHEGLAEAHHLGIALACGGSNGNKERRCVSWGWVGQ